MMPAKEQLEAARSYMAHALKPAGADGVRAALLPLMLTMEIPNVLEDMTPEQERVWFAERFNEYARLMAHVPVDIIKAASDAHVVKAKFFPSISELMEHAKPALELRQRQGERIDQMIDARNRPKTEPRAAPFKHDPRDVVLKTLIKAAERRGQHEKAAAYRHELDVLEGRAVEAPKPAPVTLPDDKDAKRVSVPIPPPSAIDTDALDRLDAALDRGIAATEEPPMPTEIPE